MPSKKKVSKKKTATANAKANAMPNNSQPVPEGLNPIGGGYAPSWKPEEVGVLHGKLTGEVRSVEMTIGRKKQERRCLEITTFDGDRYTVWESAALGAFFDQAAEADLGGEVFIRFDGYGQAKKGQNPPKLFTVAADFAEAAPF